MFFDNYYTSTDTNKIELGLERILTLLARLNNPHLNLPPVIHIAGTNGKGSVLAFLKAIFNQANYKVHRYTSPHLVKFNERIEIANQMISDIELNELSNQCHLACQILPKITPTFFEFTTAMAFLAFSKHKADVVLLETGLGGEFDATNVLPQVLVAIITTISFDHQEFLGNSLAEIAKAKAGIIKNNCPVIIANQQQQAKEVLWQVGTAKQAKIIDASSYNLPNNLCKKNLNLIGVHQLDNLKLAYLAILNQDKFFIDFSEISLGAENAKWPARLQKITFGNIKNQLKNCQIYLDGAHNLDGAKIVADFLSMQDGKKIVVFNMLKNKDLLGFLKQIQNNLDILLIIDVAFHQNQCLAIEIFMQAKELNIPVEIIDNFSKISNFLVDTDNTILICGSLYLAGYFLSLNSHFR